MPRRKINYGHFQPSSGMYAWSDEIPNLAKRDRMVIRAVTQERLNEKVATYLAHVAKTGEKPGASWSLERWLKYWLENYAVHEVRPTTLRNYTSYVNTHIVPTIGGTHLNKLTVEHVDAMHKRILEKGLTSTTALSVHRALSTALTSAMRYGKVDKNVAKIASAPRRNKPQIDALSVEEAKRLIAMFGTQPERYLWAAFILAGGRRGEILGLQWARVSDFLDLEWQLQRHPAGTDFPVDYEYEHLSRGLYLTRPKSDTSKRVVPLVEPLKSILTSWRAEAPSNPYDLVFAMPNGEPIDPHHATHKWPKVLKAAGIERKIRLHDLRHTAVDLFFEAGVDEDVIREIVGHSNRAMTRAYKSKATRDRLTRAMEPFTELFTLPGADATAKGQVGTPAGTLERSA